MYEINLHLTSLWYHGNSGKFIVPDDFFMITEDRTIAESVADFLWNIGGYTVLDIYIEFEDTKTAYINVEAISHKNQGEAI
jgi:hypothetical protein